MEGMDVKKSGLALIALMMISVIVPAAQNEPFGLPPLPEDEVRESVIFYKEGEVGLEDIAVSQRMLYWEAPSALKFHVYWTGEGEERRPEITLLEERHNGTTAFYTFLFKPGDRLIMEGFNKKVTDPSGKEVQREYRNFSHPLSDYPDDLFHVYTLEYALRGMDFNSPGLERRFSLWVPPGAVVPMIARVKGLETITLKDGTTWPCCRVEIGPDMVEFLGPILGRIIRPFLATYTFWYDTRGTHPLIKYVGPRGKVNTGGAPTEIYETTSLTPYPGGE